VIGALLVTAALVTAQPTHAKVTLGPAQAEIVRTIRQVRARFIDVEGALRSAKTWSILIALRTVLEDYPGIPSRSRAGPKAT
jgi:hypothetical protein